MSVAEMIMRNNEQQSKSWSVLSENLGKLGQQVVKQLEMSEYQKQAAEALPAMQQQMQAALQDAGSGKSADAYSKLLPLISNPAYNQNPILLPGLEYIMKATKDAAEDARLRFSYGLRAGAAGGLPAVDASAYGFVGTGDVLAEGGQPEGMPEGELLPEQQPLQGTPEQRAQQAAAQREMLDQEAEANIPQQEAQPQATPAHLAAQKNFQDVTSLPVNEQRNAAMSYGVAEVNPKQYEVAKIAGLEKYLPEFEGFAVPKESWKETGASLSGTGLLSRQSKLTAPEARNNFTKRSSNPEERGTKQNVEAAIESMKDKEMVKLFNDFDKDIYALRASTGSQPDKNNQPLFTVTWKDGNKVKITKDQYLAIQTIAGIVPATSEDAGGTPAIFRPKKKTQDQLIDQAFMELGPNATDEQIARRVKQLSN